LPATTPISLSTTPVMSSAIEFDEDQPHVFPD
jgi:hypothetical protein